MTPIEYVWHHRLVVAKKFLEFTDLPIKDIALRCGFKTTQHFSRKFEESSKKNTKSKNQRGIVKKIKQFVECLDNNMEYETEYLDVGDGIAISRRK